MHGVRLPPLHAGPPRLRCSIVGRGRSTTCSLAGYLFYFQHAAATTPQGVIPLENAEFFVHAYASTDELSNFCFELRTPARPWGTVADSLVLHLALHFTARMH